MVAKLNLHILAMFYIRQKRILREKRKYVYINTHRNIEIHILQSMITLKYPPLILGDGAFPSRTWLVKPYGEAILIEKKRYFNYRPSRARMISEGAFGKLKSS